MSASLHQTSIIQRNLRTGPDHQNRAVLLPSSQPSFRCYSRLPSVLENLQVATANAASRTIKVWDTFQKRQQGESQAIPELQARLAQTHDPAKERLQF